MVARCGALAAAAAAAWAVEAALLPARTEAAAAAAGDIKLPWTSPCIATSILDAACSMQEGMGGEEE